MNDEFNIVDKIVDKKDLEDINKLNEINKQKNEPSNGSGLFELFGQEDVKKESIVQQLESNDWTNFYNKELVHLVNKTKDDYVVVKVPVEHNNAVFRSFLETIKGKETLLNGMQAEALLQMFGRRILYGHIKQATLVKTLILNRNAFAVFHTADQCPGIDVGFLDTINLARSKRDLLVRTIPNEMAFNVNMSELLHVEGGKINFLDYLFALDYVFHNDSRYMEGTTASHFDAYYKPFVTELKKRIENHDNIMWLVNKFPNMLANTIAWDNSTGKFDRFSKDDIPSIIAMKDILHESALLIQENMKNRNLIVTAYVTTILKMYDNTYNNSIFRDL